MLITQVEYTNSKSSPYLIFLGLFQANPDIIPPILTLALNDAMTYDKVRDHYLVYLDWDK